MTVFAEPLDAAMLAKVFGYANRRGITRAIRMGTFPVPTYKFNGKRFAHAEHVNAFLDRKKAEAEEEYQAEVGEDFWLT